MCGKWEVGVNISLHLLDTPRGTVELQLVAPTKLGLEVRLRTKTTKLTIVHDALKQKERYRQTEREERKRKGENERGTETDQERRREERQKETKKEKTKC